MGRKAISNSKRFEIFKRDGFKCHYCGSTPISSILHVDHILAVSRGGTNEPDNLITACSTCNSGKGNRKLSEAKYQPALTPEETREQAKQLREWAKAQRSLEAARKEVVEVFAQKWIESTGHISQDMYSRLPMTIRTTPHEWIYEAMEIAGKKFRNNGEYSWPQALEAQRYFSGILKRKRAESGKIK